MYAGAPLVIVAPNTLTDIPNEDVNVAGAVENV